MKKLKLNKRFYRKNINMFWILNLIYKVKDNVRIFFLIIIIFVVVFIVIGIVYFFWKDVEC